MKRRICLLGLCLGLMGSTAALAVTEGVVEAAPPVEMDEIALEEEAFYLPDASYYPANDFWVPEWSTSEEYVEPRFDGEMFQLIFQNPELTSGERARARRLLEAYEAGEAAGDGEGVLGKREDVVVGVYALKPENFDGERVYVLLPGTCLTDEQILSIIDAYHRLGLAFDPEGLGYRNCMRGGGIETSRMFASEERERYVTLDGLIERGILDVTAWSGEEAVVLKLDARYYSGLDEFSLKPYRAMTDDELVTMLVEYGTHDQTADEGFDGLERRARELLTARLGCPLSMELEDVYMEGSYLPCIFDGGCRRGYAGEGRTSLGAHFKYTGENGAQVAAYASFDRETKEPVGFGYDDVTAQAAYESAARDGEETATPAFTDEEYLKMAEDYAGGRWGLTRLAWTVQDDGGMYAQLRARVQEGEWVTLYIGKRDGLLYGAAFEAGTEGVVTEIW